MKNADTITISILFCWPHLLFVSSDTNEWWRLIPFDNLNCVKTWFPRVKPTLRIQLLSWYKWFNKYTYLVIHGETYWFFSRNTGIIFSKKGVNFNHYINLLKVRFKVYKMCTLKKTSVRFLILTVRHHMQGYICKFAKSSQVHFSLL